MGQFDFSKKETETEKAWLASSEEEYEKLGLKKGQVELWEDGMRTDGGKGNYEWWYFDAKLQDESTIVVGFYTKLLTELNSGISPVIMVNINYEDGTKIEKTAKFDSSTWSASTEKCDVKIGDNYFRGNLEAYEIHFADDELTLDISITRETSSWRPETGHMMFGDEGDLFAWVVAVPQGEATVKYTYKGKEVSTTGSCYHDHNWGNKSLAELVNHWYWARAEMGPYTVIASEIIAEKAYGYSSLVVFNVSRDGQLIQDDGSKVKLFRLFAPPDSTTEKPVSREIRFMYESETERYEIKLVIQKHLLDTFLAQGPMKLLSRVLTGTEAAYSRFTGPATLSLYKNGNLQETFENDDAVWELMYFGK